MVGRGKPAGAFTPMTKLFPTIMIGLSIAAAIVYATKGWSEWQMVVYWTSAAALNYSVTW